MLKSEHKQSNDLHDDEYLSGISKNDKFIPVITLVINFSSKKWDAACCLYDIIDIDNDDILKKYITNYKLNLFDYHDYDNFDIFKTELKNIFEVARYADDMLALGQCLNGDSSYRSLSKETIEIINDINKIKVEVIGGRGDMCKAFEDYKQLGKVEGFNEGRIEGFDEGKRTVLVAMVKDGDITIEKAAMRLNISEEEFKALLSE